MFRWLASWFVLLLILGTVHSQTQPEPMPDRGAVPPGDGAPAKAAQNDSSDLPKPKKLAPALKVDFQQPLPRGNWKTAAAIAPEGPREPEYTGFGKENAAGRFHNGNYYTFQDETLEKSLRFGLNQTITIEAWVKPSDIANNENLYIIGKGRNKRADFSAENQNWALRLRGDGSQAKISFLFRSQASDGAIGDDPATGQFHRWTSKIGFVPDDRWHHVAVKYTFGKPTSIVGYLDGQPVDGTWDMGGATTRPPVQDADQIVLGSGYGGGKSNTFRGWLDEIAVYRGGVNDDELSQRYSARPAAPTIDPAEVPKGAVRVDILDDGFPAANRFPAIPVPITETFQRPALAISQEPVKYTSEGVRGQRQTPHMVRLAVWATFPQGEHRLLLRGRGSSRLTIDGKQILQTPFMSNDDSGHQHAPKDYLNLGGDFPFAPPGNRESWSKFTGTGQPQLVIMETVIGGVVGKRKRRPELGQTVVAWSPSGEDRWFLVAPELRQFAFNDAGLKAFFREEDAFMDQLNADNRQARRSANTGTMESRNQRLQDWQTRVTPPTVPALSAGATAANAIDHFLAHKREQIVAEKANQKSDLSFAREILPILESHCFSCHSGSKTKGELRLDNREGLLRGGSSGPALVPGQAKQSELIHRITSTDADTVMPPKGTKLTEEQVRKLTAWIQDGAQWPTIHTDKVNFTKLVDDETFLRRVSLDTVGVVPTREEITRLLGKPRAEIVDAYLNDPRWADHQMGYWLDILAENPNILNPTLNNTGPFRWWLYDSFRDNLPLDRLATELIQMKGSNRFGGPAGFGIASQNDSPMATKATILGTAFLGMEMKCARCHDAPYHDVTQKQLFALGAMLNEKPLKVPATSSVPMDKIHAGGRKPLIEVTLKPGTDVEPVWPFPKLFPAEAIPTVGASGGRERLALAITHPANDRFAEVLVNRIWKRLMGRGLVEPVDDWEKAQVTHPELLKYLADHFRRNRFDQKALQRLILLSHAYQRQVDPEQVEPNPLFVSRSYRRLQAEQIVDTLFHVTGREMADICGEVSLDIDGMRDLENSISLGYARRSWNLTSTSNERDRPSLALPRLQPVVDVLEAFGWRGSRQDAISQRESSIHALQPAILSNGTLTVWLSRVSEDHGLLPLATETRELNVLIDAVYRTFLTRLPTEEEKQKARELLEPGFDRRLQAAATSEGKPRTRPRYVTWSNHLTPEASEIKLEMEVAMRKGPVATSRLNTDWRERYEDFLWSMLTHPEMVYQR